MSHFQPFRNRRCSCQIGFGVRMGLGTPSFSPDLCSRFAACWMMLVFVLVPHKFLSVACGCACEALAFPAPWRAFCSTACTCQSVGLVGAAAVCLSLGFAFGCCVVNLWEGWFAEVSFRKVSPCNCACSRRGNGGGGCGQGRPCRSAVLSEPGVSEAPRYHARGVTQQGDVLGSLF